MAGRKKLPNKTSTHKVGYKSPPLHSRFQKGQSGNPKGRPKGSENILALTKRIANERVSVTTADGTTKSMPRRELFLRQLYQRGIKGGNRSEALLFSVHLRMDGNEDDIEAINDEVIARDDELLRDYQSRMARLKRAKR